MGICREASISQSALAATDKKQPAASASSKQHYKANRSKRCKSLLLLSSPFSSSSGSVKSSLLSLLHPNQSQLDLRLAPASLSSSSSSAGDELAPEGAQQRPPSRPGKCVKMKLFEQPLDKLFSPKAMKQLNEAMSAEKQLKQQHHWRTSNSAYLRRFSTDSNNNNSSSISNSSSIVGGKPVSAQLLSVLPEPIRNLLNELYLRGPSTVGIFRKSPNAKHCKELRQKLETDSQSSIEQFQVTVVASVFKEWLRSLPDCLLMSRLYPQWIAVAKLIEPLHQHQQQQQFRHQTQSLDDSHSDNTISGNTSLRPASPSPLTDSAAGQLMLDRARSCSTTMASNDFHSIGADNGRQPSGSMSAFALSERHSECVRIVRQLLDALSKSNLVLLQSFIAVLWHIAANSEHNKMSANNLGVCVGQSLLNDEHQTPTVSTFTKRHRRTRSQCILSSTLSLASSNPSLSQQSTCYLDTSGAQETAKYVPMLVAFMIDNAPALFGQHITSLFSPLSGQQPRSPSSQAPDQQENQPPMDFVDGDTRPTDAPLISRIMALTSPPRRQHIILQSRFRPSQEPDTADLGQLAATSANRNINYTTNGLTADTAGSNTTSILIVNAPKRHTRSDAQAQQRPLSATESTSSSHASSSTSGVHSESPAFSSESIESSSSSSSSSSNARNTASSPSLALSSESPCLLSESRLRPNHDEEAEASAVEEAAMAARLRPSANDRSVGAGSQAQRGAISPETPPTARPQPSNKLQPQQQQQQQKQQQQQQPQSQPSKQQLQPDLAAQQQQHQLQQRQTSMPRYRNRHLMDSYSTFMGVLNRVPKIPVQFTTSSYGGEAVIYNPRQHGFMVPPASYLAQQQQQQQQKPHLHPLLPLAVFGELTAHQTATIQRPQPRMARIRQNSHHQFNGAGVYVKAAHYATLANSNGANFRSPGPVPMPKQTGSASGALPVRLSSSGHSSDDSDDSYLNDWAESTMV